MDTAFIFPAFVSDFIGNEQEILNELSDDLNNHLKITAHLVDDCFNEFSITDTRFLNNELYNQITSYVFSCSLSRILESNKLRPDIVAGNSMGLYAALYCGKVINFMEGLNLIVKAYDLIQENIKGFEAGMGAIIGHKRAVIQELIKKHVKDVWIVNCNGLHSFLVSGRKPEIVKLLDIARDEGALFASLLNVKSPYHSPLTLEASSKFREYINSEIEIDIPASIIISSANQKTLGNEEDITEELVRNLCNPINWFATMKEILSFGVTTFIECGGGNSLYKISKFIKGDFKVYPINKINKILG